MNQTSEQSISLLREANALMAQHEHVQASLKYLESISLQPSNAIALHNLAALQMGANSSAQQTSGLYLFQIAAAILGSDQYRADYALALTHMGKAKQALKYLSHFAHEFQNQAAFEKLESQIEDRAGLSRPALRALSARKPKSLSFESLNRLADQGRHDQIIGHLHNTLETEHTDWRIWHLVSQSHRKLAQAHQAQGAARACLALDPDNVSLHILNSELLSFGGLHYAAAACTERSLHRLGQNPDLLATASYAYANNHQPEKAIALYEGASAENQQHIRFRFGYANALAESGRQSDATEVVLELAHENPATEMVLLGALRILNRPGAGAQMKQVFDLLDTNGVTLTQNAGHFFRALMLLDLGEVDEALEVVESHFDPKAPATDEQANFAMVAGRLYDKAKAYDKAFEMYELGNRLSAKLTIETGRISPTSFPEQVQLLRTDLMSKASDDLSTHKVKSAPNAPKMAFMYSFPRSGTTLLDTIFRSHSNIEVLEEEPTIRDTLMDAHFGSAPHKHGTSWADLIESFYNTEPEHLQSLYYKNFERFYGSQLEENKVYIDKMPLNTTFARIIKYIFPDSKIIFSIRDPADVITSCFAQNFLMNDAMFHFTSIERAVAVYDQVMSFWVKAEEILDLDVTYVRYEELITDLQGVVQPVVEGLGLSWEDGLVDFWKTAREREVIRTASAGQVIQKLYTTSQGRWTRYSALNDGALDSLEPWRKHFGYA